MTTIQGTLYYSPLKKYLALLGERLITVEKIYNVRTENAFISYITNFFNSNNSFIKKCQVFFNGLYLPDCT